MKRGLLLSCLLALVALVGSAQEITKFPITLTAADGLPGPKIVQNFVFKSKVYNLEKEVTKLRFTVCSTNTAETAKENSHDGISANEGPGYPFFTMSEFRIYNGEGKQIEYTATTNSVDPNDGGGVEILNDGKENSHYHSAYGGRCLSYAYDFHYLEFELAEPVSSFSFNWNTRSGYYKNLITYMGITDGTIYHPYPEQEFQLGEQVTSPEEFAKEGALFVLQGDANTFIKEYNFTLNSTGEEINNVYEYPGNLYMLSPYGGTETPSAANLFYLTPDVENENTYKFCWLNTGRYILAHKYTGGAGNDEWASWTKDITRAASIEFAPCDTVEGNFSLSMDNKLHFLGYDGYARMGLMADEDSALYTTSRPTSYTWKIYKASINGSAITAQLQAEIDEADARIEAIGGKVPNYDEGEYDALAAALSNAKELVANPEVTAAEILAAKRNLNRLTAAYAAVGLWVYVDSIATIGELIENEELPVCQGPEWVNGAYNLEVFDAMQMLSDNIQLVIEKCESLADVDIAIEEIYNAISQFWASKISGVKELPFRVGTPDDGLPGTNVNRVWIWESPMYLLTEEVDALRFTVFKTHSGRNVSGFDDRPFVCINEFELYDQSGAKIPLTADCFETNSIAGNDGAGLAGLCDGGKETDTGKHFHSAWSTDDEFTGEDYFYLDIILPEPISGFKYIQYGRGNDCPDTPTDFVFSAAGETYTPDDIDLPELYNTKLGEKVTDASQITDDGLYAIVGLINCAPEGDGSGYEKFYSSNNVYGKKIAAPCAFTITKTGDEDGTFYIRSLSDSKFWSNEIDEDGWNGGSATSDITKAGKFHIVPNAEARADADKEEFPNTFAIYMYNDTVKRANEQIDDSGTPVPHPYIVAQDWGGGTGYFSIPDLTYNDFDGEGEWYIYKMTMDNPYIYWLKSVYAAASAVDVKVGPDPGFYSEATAGEYAKALIKAQAAIEADDNATAKEAVFALEAASGLLATAEVNPMVPGSYVVEASWGAYFEQQGVTKAMCSYFNDFEDEGALSDYSLWWTDGPTDLENPAIYYQFEFISAANSEQVLVWLEDSVITAEQAANAYFIKSKEIGQYIGISSITDDEGIPQRSKDIGFTEEPEYPYIVRATAAYQFDLWCPVGPNNCLHMESHNNGGGSVGDIVYWGGGANTASAWTLRSIDARTSIDTPVVSPEGEVVSTSYYTVGGAAVAAPVKGINIVKKVYANGAVESSKIFVK
ncbi:MAG: hypothetical protein IKY69_04305 [Bacteroidaceae bacterium]|nr:hypothetical protein [Bacteroidaceae bacterium]